MNQLIQIAWVALLTWVLVDVSSTALRIIVGVALALQIIGTLILIVQNESTNG